MVLGAPVRVDAGRLPTDRVLPVVTGEGAALELELAGLGARAAAAAIDLVLAGAVFLVLRLLGGHFVADRRSDLIAVGVERGDDVLRSLLQVAPVALGLAVLVPLVQELLLGGRTLGKRAMRVRVVTTTGARPEAGRLLIRNLLRLVDLLPGTYAVGALLILLGGDARRLGDVAAGTVVVRQRRALLVYGQIGLPPTPWQSMGPPTVDGQAIATARVDTRSWDVSGLTAEHREVLQAFASRRYGLPPAVRENFTRWLASVLRRAVVGIPDELEDETLIDALLLRFTVARQAPGRSRVS